MRQPTVPSWTRSKKSSYSSPSTSSTQYILVLHWNVCVPVLGSCLLHLPTIRQCRSGPAAAAAPWDFPKITLDPKRPMQRGKAKRDEALSPKVHYTKHNVPDEAIPSLAGCLLLGLCCALGSKRSLCICFLLAPYPGTRFSVSFLSWMACLCIMSDYLCCIQQPIL